MRPRMLDPKRDLKGATPETLARALLRPRQVTKPVVSNEVSKQKPSPDKPGNRVPHLVKRS